MILQIRGASMQLTSRHDLSTQKFLLTIRTDPYAIDVQGNGLLHYSYKYPIRYSISSSTASKVENSACTRCWLRTLDFNIIPEPKRSSALVEERSCRRRRRRGVTVELAVRSGKQGIHDTTTASQNRRPDPKSLNRTVEPYPNEALRRRKTDLQQRAVHMSSNTRGA